LVRHGETTWNVEGRYQGQIDTPLSERGWEQGKKVAQALSAIRIDAIYATPLSRALETANLCASYHRLDVKIEERLIEINHGEWEGLLSHEVGERWGAELQLWRTKVIGVQMPGGENIDEVRDRSMVALNHIVQLHQDQTVLIVAHDAVNKAILCSVLETDLSHFWQIKQDNCCMNVIEYIEGVPRVAMMNNTSHMGYLISGIEQKGL
jgi:phosphoserine phosphatase